MRLQIKGTFFGACSSQEIDRKQWVPIIPPMESLLDSVWVLVSAFLVFFMHAGFALVESGFCRRKNVVMVLLKNVAVVSVASILFYFVGFGLMFGDGSPWLGMNGFSPAADASVAGAPGNMPLFVFLIPVIMLFSVGEFSALIAIIMYGIAVLIEQRLTGWSVRGTENTTFTGGG